MNDNGGLVFIYIAIIFCIISAVIANKVRDKYPQAIEDVYQGKTALEYTIRDGEIVDSVIVVVVFKNK